MLWIFLTGLAVALFSGLLLIYQITSLVYSVFPLLIGLLFVLSYNGRDNLRLLCSSVFIALVLSVPLIGIDTWTPQQLDFLFLYPWLLYFVHCFHYAYHHNGDTWTLSYNALFEAGWNTLLVLLVGVFFVYALATMIFGASLLFSSMGSPQLYKLFMGTAYFPGFLGIFSFFIGLGIGQNNIKLLNPLRFTVVNIMYYFMPILVVTSLIYFILFLAHVSESSDAILGSFFVLVVISILFLQAYYQDGREDNRPTWLNVVLRVHKVLILIMTLLFSYDALNNNYLNINQLILVTVLLFLGWMYAYGAVLSEEKAQQSLEDGNKYMALTFITLLYLANLPYLPVNFTVNKTKPALSIWSSVDFMRKHAEVEETSEQSE